MSIHCSSTLMYPLINICMIAFLKLDNSNKLIIHFSSCFLVLPGAFQSAVHGVITHAEYATGVRHTIRAGGCNCSRAGFIGACLGAQVGHDTTCLRAIRNHNSQHRKLRNTKKNNCDFSSIIFSIFFFILLISWEIFLETKYLLKQRFSKKLISLMIFSPFYQIILLQSSNVFFEEWHKWYTRRMEKENFIIWRSFWAGKENGGNLCKVNSCDL